MQSFTVPSLPASTHTPVMLPPRSRAPLVACSVLAKPQADQQVSDALCRRRRPTGATWALHSKLESKRCSSHLLAQVSGLQHLTPEAQERALKSKVRLRAAAGAAPRTRSPRATVPLP